MSDQWKMYNNYCYLTQDGVGGQGLTWRKARENCTGNNGDLVSIQGINEQLFVQWLVS